MKVLLLDTEKLRPQVIETEGGFTEWCRLIKCDLTDRVNRQIGGRYYEIILDMEGILKPQSKVTALDKEGQPMLVGNLVICNYDLETGEQTTLTDEDIAHIIKHIVVLTETDKEDPQRWLALNYIEY